MNIPIRLVIDYASGEHWEMPISLYAKYTDNLSQFTGFYCSKQTLVEAWIDTLSIDERTALVRR